MRLPGRRAAWALIALALAIFIGLTIIAPLLLVLLRSLGSPVWVNYVANLRDPTVIRVLLRTVFLALEVSLVTLALSYPSAYALTRLAGRWRRMVLALVLLPSLTSFIVRSYAWLAILAHNGPAIAVLNVFGIHTYSLIGTSFGV